ncbi:hypothetical protein LEP1GSC052_4316 [Leptospira kmetyi serovar Malaysia str. Bejo-Iso9]|nr:hypothetical protein LEP1GSC052_4316 [Leptospira kmetyi serovar Malaysia str. Bejo-Iso9]
MSRSLQESRDFLKYLICPFPFSVYPHPKRFFSNRESFRTGTLS